MFGKDYSDGVSSDLISTAMADWKAFWIYPAGMAFVIAGVFFLAFWDKSADGDNDEKEEA
jgi:hypothetical protein